MMLTMAGEGIVVEEDMIMIMIDAHVIREIRI